VKKQVPFEEMFTQLEQVVQKLESDTLTLDESLKLFEKGMKLSGECRKKLQAAELIVKKVVREGETQHLEDFTAEQDPT
jgi:exodeoxyribonuclease VII small subunit